MVTLLDSDGGKNDVLRQKRRQEKQFVYDIAFGEDLSQVSTWSRLLKQSAVELIVQVHLLHLVYIYFSKSGRHPLPLSP